MLCLRYSAALKSRAAKLVKQVLPNRLGDITQRSPSYFLLLRKTIKIFECLQLPLLCASLGHGEACFPTARECSRSPSYFLLLRKTIKIFECLNYLFLCASLGHGEACLPTARECSRSPSYFFVKEDNKNIRVFEITSLCASLGDGEACFLRQGAAHIRPHIFYC